jgi:NADH:ubiquinone oxidoreductase subunit H
VNYADAPFTHKICKLGFRFRCDFGIIHGGTFLLVVFCAIGILPKTVKRMSHFFSRFRLSVARVQKMGKLQAFADDFKTQNMI